MCGMQARNGVDKAMKEYDDEQALHDRQVS